MVTQNRTDLYFELGPESVFLDFLDISLSWEQQSRVAKDWRHVIKMPCLGQISPIDCGQNGLLILFRMKWSPFHFGQNEMEFISFWPKWSVHFGQNEMDISFRPKWNGIHFILTEMKCPFWPNWNGHFILAKLNCNFCDRLKKHAARPAPHMLEPDVYPHSQHTYH